MRYQLYPAITAASAAAAALPRLFTQAAGQAAITAEQLAQLGSTLARKQPRMKLHNTTPTTGQRRALLTRSQARKAAADRAAAERGLNFNARDYFARVQTVKKIHLDRLTAQQTAE